MNLPTSLRPFALLAAAFVLFQTDSRPAHRPLTEHEEAEGAIDPSIVGYLGPATNEVLRPVRPFLTVGANTLVNDRTLCPNGLGLTQNETAIAVSGNVVVAAFNDSRGVCDPDHHAVVGWAYSLDNGNTWTDGGRLPASNQLNGGDPWLGVSSDGQTFYLAGLWNYYTGVGFYRGTVTDSGIQWSDPTVISFPPSVTHDKEAFAVDPNSGSIYLTYNRIGIIGTPSGIYAIRSDDGGLTWTPQVPVFITSPKGAIASFPVVDNQGNLFVAYQIDGVLMEVSRSIDSGASFQTVAGFTYNAATVPFLDRASQFPQIAVDTSGGPRDGWLYLVSHSGSKFGDRTSISITHSADHGITWTLPTAINTDQVITYHWWPTVSVDAAGNVNVIFLDRRNHPGTGLTDTFFAQSPDGGKTFINIQVNDVTSSWEGIRFDPAFTSGGDYIRAVSQGTSVYAVWPDTRNGDPDIYFSRIDTP